MDATTTTTTATGGTPLQLSYQPNTCLFCRFQSADFNSSAVHMQKSHGLFIPDKDHLVVEPEDLFKYLHLVIHEYRECLHCGAEKSTVQAVQQHMMDRGHCRFDISTEDSEFRDFYDFSESELSSDDDQAADQQDEGRRLTADESMRLPSGRIISSRSAPQPRPQRLQRRSQSPAVPSQLEYQAPASESEPKTGLTTDSSAVPEPSALTKREEKKRSILSARVASLSQGDRASLMHMPSAQQRAILATHQKQLDKAVKAERKQRNRLDALEQNRLAYRHYNTEVPIPLGG